MQNPINKERVISVEEQLIWWMAGCSLHNGQTSNLGECTPDFSCCHPELLNVAGERIKYTMRKLKESLLEYGDFEHIDKLTIESWFDQFTE